MKAVKLLVVLAAAVMVSVTAEAATDVSVGVAINSADDFYEPLSTQGYWVEVGSYGRCWHPYYVAATWRPYCEGTWVWTDAGWYWQSDEPWGWACYHYGRWTFDSYYGWLWVPDVEWAPAWVCFRQGGGYCGWAPMPPGWHGGVVSVGLVPAGWFVFVGEHHFGEHLHARNVIINNTTIINRTTIIERTRTTVNNRVIADGPRVQDLQRVNRERIRTSTVTELRQHERAPAIIHRPVPTRENVQQMQHPETVTPERERPHGNPPEIIRGPPNVPGPPPSEQRQRVDPPPEQKPGPPPGQRAAPPPHEKDPPPGEERREEHDQERPAPPQGGGR